MRSRTKIGLLLVHQASQCVLEAVSCYNYYEGLNLVLRISSGTTLSSSRLITGSVLK